MTITILKLDTAKGHRIPRPWSRACSVSEMEELLSSYCRGNGWSFARSISGKQYDHGNLDTDKPVLKIAGTTVKFYAFTEE